MLDFDQTESCLRGPVPLSWIRQRITDGATEVVATELRAVMNFSLPISTGIAPVIVKIQT